ncbi:hypothetical protein [Colwellia sp. PAMC 21821]|nr:hypothetical protein [Colwellia sp. PAMC 21821]
MPQRSPFLPFLGWKIDCYATIAVVQSLGFKGGLSDIADVQCFDN